MDLVLLIARLGLAAVFAVAGIAKQLDLPGLRWAVAGGRHDTKGDPFLPSGDRSEPFTHTRYQDRHPVGHRRPPWIPIASTQ